jgi:hypothetical protein
MMYYEKKEDITYCDMQEILKRLFIKIRDCYPKQILGVPQRGISLHEVQSALCETSKYLTLSGLGKGRFRRFSFAGTSPEVFKAMEIKFTRSVEYRRDIELFRFGTEDERNDLFSTCFFLSHSFLINIYMFRWLTTSFL